jgi:hypothetical protein
MSLFFSNEKAVSDLPFMQGWKKESSSSLAAYSSKVPQIGELIGYTLCSEICGVTEGAILLK